MNTTPHLLATAMLAVLGITPLASRAQTPACTPEHAAMGHCTMPTNPATPTESMPMHAMPGMAMPAATPPATDPSCPPEHAAMGHCTPKPATPACSPEHAVMGHCTMPPAASASPRPMESMPMPGMAGMAMPATTPPAADPACPPEHAAMGHCTPRPAKPATPGCSPEHAAMGHCSPARTSSGESTALPRTPIPALTDADRAAAFPTLSHASMDHGEAIHHYVLLDRLETWDADPGRGQAWEGSAWVGGDIDRLWLRSEGQRTRGRLASADIEALYGHAVGPWWDLLLGARNDSGGGPSRQWAAIGVQGLAPYKFELSATAYVGTQGRTAAKVEADYDVLLSNRLILQPRIETWWHGRDDPATRTGAGLGSAEAGLRLRYEITRQFAPYVGVVHERRFGRSADYARADGEGSRDTRWVAGLRAWF